MILLSASIGEPGPETGLSFLEASGGIRKEPASPTFTEGHSDGVRDGVISQNSDW